MNTTTGTSVAWAAVLCLFSGCTQNEARGDGDETVGQIDDAFQVWNAINPNSLNPKTLDPNGLNPMDLLSNPLNPGTISASVMSAIQNPDAIGDLSRQLVRYLVNCGFDSTQSFSFSRNDFNGTPVHETFAGHLGLAKDWENKPISVAEQEWVSACIYSRLNWYQVPVMISSRAAEAPLDTTDAVERAEYSFAEGAFWGNLFLQTPKAYACNMPQNAAHDRSLQRDCAVGHLNFDSTTSPCGILQIVGDCETHCTYRDSIDLYFNHCTETTTGSVIKPSPYVISTFLP